MDGRISRRGFLAAGAALSLAACSGGTGSSGTGSPGTDSPGAGGSDAGSTPPRPRRRPDASDPKLAEYPFTLGVASGDPLPEAVILWTRLLPVPGGEVPVHWEVAADERFARVVRRGTVAATADAAHSIHVDATGLDPARGYWYRFLAGGHESPKGRTRTAPARGADASAFTFAFTSCQQWQNGYWPVYRAMAADDLDLVVHLGDYIYEGGTREGAVRPHNARPDDLDGYRARHALYKSDRELQAAHAACPWLVTWDDHEVQNNYAASISNNADPAAAFAARRTAAYRAWWEHQPVRAAPPTGAALSIYRRFTFGRLATFHVLDGRQYRSRVACGKEPLSLGTQCPEALAENRSMLGMEQEQWLADGMRASRTTWNVVANQTIMAEVPIQLGSQKLVNLDQWDGYIASRRRVLQAITAAKASGPVVITGDIHAGGVADLKEDYADAAAPVVGTELIAPPVSSSIEPLLATFAEARLPSVPWFKYFDGRRHGYVRSRLGGDECRSDFRTVDTIADVAAPTTTTASFVIAPDRPGATRA